MSNEPVWFIYINEQQQGPFSKAQLYQQFKENQLPPNVHVFRTGWKEWMPLEACLAELGLPLQIDGSSLSIEERRRKGPRVGIAGQIIVHNQGDLAIGSGVNLSATGLFIETTQQLFQVGEILFLTCKVKQISTPFHAKAEVARFNVGNAAVTGFGLRWTEIPPTIQQDIQRLVDHPQSTAETGTPSQSLPPIPTAKKAP